jgi:dipeptidyl aminopeptidase/acylaminoacyl peptidase
VGSRRWTAVALPLLLLAGALAIGAQPARAAFPGVNGKIVFAGLNLDLYVMDADGSNQTRLTTSGAFHSAWSADGTRIAFDSTRDGNWEIYVMDADGSNQTRLTTDSRFDQAPAWSPDGTKIAFTAGRSDEELGRIYVMNADGSNQTELSTGPVADSGPAWSPDGSKIAFESLQPVTGQSDIYVMNADGSNVLPLTSDPAYDGAANWSPDGSQIAFMSFRSGNGEIYVMNADGSNVLPLTTDPAADYLPAWSPDGTEIVFQSFRSGNSDIYIMNADGTNQTRVTTDPVDEWDPDWQPVASPSIAFDWTMPDRFGADGDGDGLTDYYPPDGNLVIDPGSWQVDFAATDPNYCDPTYTHTWFIDSVQVDPSDPNIVSYDPATCGFSYAFPEEAVHDVGLEVTDAQGTVVGTGEHMVTVQDFLIVSIGDSVGSGEGNPDVPKPSLAWENEQCHRSAWAGPAQAAKLIEQADPRTSVTFIHLACSGATVYKGLLGPYEGIEPGALLAPQVDEMVSLVGSREIDGVLVSVGANDVKFSDIVTKCFGQADCTDPSDPASAASFFARVLPALPPRYDDLAATLNGGGEPAADRTYLSGYFDPTRGRFGAACQGRFGILEDAPFSPFGEITAPEATWASDTMLTQLNTTVSSAAGRNGWRFVGGQFADFATHGYCALGQSWVDTWKDSQRLQGDRFGTIHPNRAGHADYAAHLQASLQLDLYVGGDLSQPRAPAP